MTDAGILHSRLVTVLELYKVDYVIDKTVVEFLGRPYHLSQVDGSLDLRTQVKVRHLIGSGRSVILVLDLLEFIPKLMKALALISSSPHPLAVLLGGSSLSPTFLRTAPITHIV